VVRTPAMLLVMHLYKLFHSRGNGYYISRYIDEISSGSIDAGFSMIELDFITTREMYLMDDSEYYVNFRCFDRRNMIRQFKKVYPKEILLEQ
jgi:hypothetical protein